MEKPLLALKNLTLGFESDTGFAEVVHGIDIHIERGEIVGLIGESGSGKTLSMKSLLGGPGESFEFKTDHLFFDGKDLSLCSEKEWNALRGNTIAYIPQNASDALTPHHTVEKQLLETAKIHKRRLTRLQMIDKLTSVGISEPESVLSMYPRQLSGGMAQRVLIAMSTLLNPKLIIADEPTSAIDASLKNVVLELLLQINRSEGTSIIVITHDFDVVSKICNRAYVMYRGHILEEGCLPELLTQPKHVYTKGLIQCFASLSEATPEFYFMPSEQILQEATIQNKNVKGDCQ